MTFVISSFLSLSLRSSESLIASLHNNSIFLETCSFGTLDVAATTSVLQSKRISLKVLAKSFSLVFRILKLRSDSTESREIA